MHRFNVGSICSGIEAASVAWEDIGFEFSWFSEIAAFPSKLLAAKYPETPNLGDMCKIHNKIRLSEIDAPDIICGGTPCQAFSFAGWKKGLDDDRGNLTLKLVDIIEENDNVRAAAGKSPTIVLWENVEGVLKDRTNAFGCFVSSLAGLTREIKLKRWPKAGLISGPTRNVAWRVLDAKFFGLPQQRKRLYVLAGGKNFSPDEVLFEKTSRPTVLSWPEEQPLQFEKNGHSIEIFRSYCDCLYSAYGTKWNGNAAAYNGSLFVAQNGRLRRFSPLECERLMGFPDGYTDLHGTRPTSRYQAIGNSWAVPVIKWLGERILNSSTRQHKICKSQFSLITQQIGNDEEGFLIDFSNGHICLDDGRILNCAEHPEHAYFGSMHDIIDVNAEENFYISPAGCKGILRRSEERKKPINKRLEAVLVEISSMWSEDKIEKISRKQSRGRYSDGHKTSIKELRQSDSPLFD